MKSKILMIALILSSLYMLASISQSFESTYLNEDLNNESYDGYEENPFAQHDPIVHLGNEDGGKYCTGFVISKHYAITAAHCVTGTRGVFYDDKIIVTSHGGLYSVEAKIVGFNNRMDTAIISGDFSLFAFMPIQYKNIRLDQTTYLMCGFPLGVIELNCNPSLIMGKFGFGYAMSGLVFPGHSGGPTLNPETLEVIGINSAAYGNISIVSPTFGIIDNFRIGR